MFLAVLQSPYMQLFHMTVTVLALILASVAMSKAGYVEGDHWARARCMHDSTPKPIQPIARPKPMAEKKPKTVTLP